MNPELLALVVIRNTLCNLSPFFFFYHFKGENKRLFLSFYPFHTLSICPPHTNDRYTVDFCYIRSDETRLRYKQRNIERNDVKGIRRYIAR